MILDLLLGSSVSSIMVFIKALLFMLLQYFVLHSGHATLEPHNHTQYSSLTDKAALLAFKSAIIFDPNATLANWNEAVDLCNFQGVTCNKYHHRVAELNLPNKALKGLLSPFISNLTRLKVLVLTEHNFFGVIPSEFSLLRNLYHLQLDGNNLHGPIPESFALLSKLSLLTLFDNDFKGTLPPSIFYNCTSLRNIDLSYNYFTGKIPQEIGNSPGLWNLNLYNNHLTGQLPASLVNTSLYNLDLESNHLSGELPSDIIGDLAYLQLSYNNMVSHDDNNNLDPFFTALENCTLLYELELAGMGLGGTLTRSIGQLSMTTVSMQENKITGSIPPYIGNLSNLMLLNFTLNCLNGTISEEISRLSNLKQLSLSHNLFSGEISAVLGRLPYLGLLDLSYNKFFGQIPASLGNLVRVNYMFLNNNLLSGRIPQTLGQCIDLNKLDLSYNRLTGRIPTEILGIRQIRIFLNLSHNQLEGPLPIELSKLENVLEIDLSSNNFTGNIFPEISSCIAVRMINLSHNFLEGHLTDSLVDLKNIKSIDVSGNKLSGAIPMSLNKIHSLSFINLSFNKFEGTIPLGGVFDLVTNMSFLGNQGLCGVVPGMPICSKKRHWFRSAVLLIIFILAACISTVSLTICCVLKFGHFKVIISSANSKVLIRQITPQWMHQFPRITYRELSEATGGFDEQTLIGKGSYGNIYKGILPDGTAIAVKVLHLQSSYSAKSFNRECQALRRVRHKNLIRVTTICCQPNFKAIVFPYMEKGSLESHLYPQSKEVLSSGSSDLTLIERVNICSDIAEGMAYLHHYSPVEVIHCDLKLSNVLLKNDMTAVISDFGIARITIEGVTNAQNVENIGNSTANMLCGSIGYIAPEYAFGSKKSTKGDVYSFGILVLEMMTRIRPTDDIFIDGINLHKWVKTQYNEGVEKFIDFSLIRAARDQSPEVKRMWEIAIRELIKLGILCTQASPSTRPTMLDAADDLNRLKRYLNSDTTAKFASSLRISSSILIDD